MSSYSLTKARIVQYVGILFALGLIAVGYWYFSASAGVKKNTSASQPQGTGQLDSGLRGYWKLDDASGTTAADSSTNSNNGTLTNGPTWTTGQIGGAVSFDGTNDYIDLGTVATNDMDVPFTQSLWAYPTAVGDSMILMEGQDANGTETYIQAVNSFGNLVIKVGINGSGTGIQTGYTAINTWYHIVMTYDGTTLSFYLNGTLYGSANYAGSITERANNMRIGADKDGTGNFTGKVDEVRSYDRVLSSDEVGQLYRLTTPTSVDTSLEGYWSFNAQDMNGTTAYDRSGAGNNGALTGGAVGTVGRLGQAVNLDGTNDYVVIPNNSSLQMSSSVSFSFWMRPGTLGGESYDTLVSKWDNYYTDIQTGTGIIEFGVDANAGALSSKTTVVAGNWYFVSAVFDDTGNTMSLYINGVLDNSQAAAGTMTPTTDNLMIGSWDTTTEFFTGQIDEVRVYSRALSASEIKSQYDLGAPDKGNTSAAQAQGTGRLDSGLISYYPLDDGSGTTATDTSVNGNNGTLTNGPLWVTGQVGSAVDFDGTDDYIQKTDTAIQDFGDTDNFTLSGWFNRDTATTDDVILAKRSSLLAASAGYMVYLDDATDQLIFEVSDGTDEYSLTSVTTFTATGWNHFVVVWDQDSAANSEIYINGIANSATDSGTIGNIGDLSNAVSFGIGVNSLAGDDYDGKIDEIRVYDRTLSTDEIGQLYRLSAPTSVESGIRGYWSFNGSDTEGTTAYDRSGARNTGTLTGGPVGAVGRVGQALSFDGTNDEITTAINQGTASTLKTLTLSVWFKTSSASGKNLIGMEDAQTGTGSTAYDRKLWIGSDGKIRFGMYTTTSYIATSLTALNDGLWHHAVGISTGDNGTVSLYIDGTLQESSSISGTIYTYSGTSYWRIGSYRSSGTWTNGSDGYYTGQLDEIRIYNRALTVAEIKSQYDLGAPDKGNTSVSQPQGTGRLDSDLVGYWKLDENTGTSAADSSTNGNTGTLTNGPTWIAGQIGSGVQFDGTNDYIDAGTDSSLILTDRRTISAWVYISGTMVNGDEYYIARKFSSGDSNSYYGMTLFHNGTGTVLGSYGGGGGAYVYSTGYLAAGQWHHVAVTFDKPNISFYINGKLDSTGADTVGGGYPSGSGTMVLGTLGGGSYLNGRLDEVRVYGRPLSADEVGQLYRLSAPTGTDTSLKGYWSFNGQDVSGTTAFDRSGAGNTGTLTNGTAKGIGKLGQALSFDGTDDYVTAPDANSLDITGNLTIALWMKKTGNTTTNSWADLVTKSSNGANDTNYYFQIADVGGTEYPGFYFYTGGVGYEIRSSVAVPLNEWHHVAITYDDAGNAITFYVDGVATTDVNMSGAPESQSLTTNAQPLYFGNRYTSNTQPYQGYLDEIRIYNRTLSATEITGLYNLSK